MRTAPGRGWPEDPGDVAWPDGAGRTGEGAKVLAPSASTFSVMAIFFGLRGQPLGTQPIENAFCGPVGPMVDYSGHVCITSLNRCATRGTQRLCPIHSLQTRMAGSCPMAGRSPYDHEVAQREYREYGDGWIAFSAPVPPSASIAAALDAIRESFLQDEDAREPLRLGPAGNPRAFLTAIDCETSIPLTPQLGEFYAYARWWRGSALLGEVLDPDDLLEHLTDPRIDLQRLLDDEFEYPYPLVDTRGAGLDPARCVLFSLDTLTWSPYNRVYLVFDPPEHSRAEGCIPGEPEVWGFVGEHFHSPDLRSYLVSLLAGSGGEP